jgi:hypothetical protein
MTEEKANEKVGDILEKHRNKAWQNRRRPGPAPLYGGVKITSFILRKYQIRARRAKVFML